MLWPYRQAQHTPTCIIRRENRRQAHPGQTNNYVGREHFYRVVRIRLCGGNKEGTRQLPLAATDCIRPNNGWNLMATAVHTLLGSMGQSHSNGWNLMSTAVHTLLVLYRYRWWHNNDAYLAWVYGAVAEVNHFSRVRLLRSTIKTFQHSHATHN